jgi:hypothetical protein
VVVKAAKHEARKAKVAAVMAAASPALLAGQAMVGRCRLTLSNPR